MQNSISKLIFAGYTGSKNPVQNRLKQQFVELDFSKLIFQKSSRDQQGASLNRFSFIKPRSLEDPKLKAIVSKFDAALRLESNSPLHQLLGAISPKLTKMFNPGYTGAPY